jgi:DNA repair protein RecN (Recombination protein N)
VDAGIGGAVAETVGKLLHQLGQSHQIFVRHPRKLCLRWPRKAITTSRSASLRLGIKRFHKFKPFGRSERVEEVARVLGGATITDTTRRHARELLEQR